MTSVYGGLPRCSWSMLTPPTYVHGPARIRGNLHHVATRFGVGNRMHHHVSRKALVKGILDCFRVFFAEGVGDLAELHRVERSLTFRVKLNLANIAQVKAHQLRRAAQHVQANGMIKSLLAHMGPPYLYL